MAVSDIIAYFELSYARFSIFRTHVRVRRFRTIISSAVNKLILKES